MWQLHPGFVELMKDWWEGFDVHDPPGQRFRLKLKGLRDVLRVWNKEVFGDIDRKKKSCLDDILRWDKKEGDEGLDEDDLIAWKEAHQELERVLEMEEIMWPQKSRVQWLKEGDQNTKFFHRMTTSRRAINHIHCLRVGDDMVENETDI